ncbi:MAG: alkaline phosphatase family protein [Anaerolineae bacterium]|nr:alkaline phosphatase family protein [Anaerolineae bacterium]
MRTIIIGLDAFDPTMFERLSGQGKLPNLTRYVEAGGYARFEVANPPQTEVSWTSIATSLNPGGHGIFDFVHRDPQTYTPYVSLLPTKRGVGGIQFVPPYTARTIFEEATRQGFPSTALWWPAMFPARLELPVRMLPGLGTPDIQGRWGVGTLFVTGAALGNDDGDRKIPVESLERHSKDRYSGVLKGPARKKRGGSEQAVLPFQLDLTDGKSARLRIDKCTLELVEGEWSPIIELSFKVGALFRVRVLTRVILSQIQPDVRLYILPLQLHPLHSPWRYATPGPFVKETWMACGPFLTLGWPQDTTALEEGCITDDQFLALCESIFETREQVLMRQLERFREGLLASVFDSLDRIQHMFWRQRPDIVGAWYVKLDGLIGRVVEQLGGAGADRTRFLVVSDHGFANFDYKAHVNRWLVEHGYLVPQQGNQSHSLKGVDWSQSQAYAVGLNSVYVNLVGREGRGAVLPDQCKALSNRLRDELLVWRGPDDRPVAQEVWLRDEVFEGPLATYGPDIVIGFSPGYRASAETGLGKWKDVNVEINRDHWGGDHCIASPEVPGVLFSNQDLRNYPHPSYRNIPALTIGAELDSGGSTPPPTQSFGEEDQEVVEERLKSLGYL